MPTKFAMPIMHITSGDYLPFTGKYMQGRGFYQPVESLKIKDLFPSNGPSGTNPDDPISNLFAPGIEMFFDGVDAEVSNIYSMFDGFITWKDNKLILTPEPKTLNELAKHTMVEAPLGRVIYYNLEKASIKTALIDLIVNSFQWPINHHPILRGGVISSLGPVSFKTIEALLQAAAPITINQQQAIEPVVEIFLSGGHRFQVLAGDLLGKADFFKTVDKLPPLSNRPAWFKTITDTDRARRILIVTKDVGKQVLNPWYYLHQYNSSSTVTPITVLRNVHPLLVNNIAPEYGRQIMGMTYYIPPGDLNTFHRFPNNDPDSLDHFIPRPGYEWRYDDKCLFEVKTNEIKDGVPVSFAIPGDINPKNRYQKKLTTMKGLYLELLNPYCKKMQVPVEVMLGLISAESTGKTTGDVRLEPLKDENEAALKTTDLFHKYNKLTGLHCKANHVIKEGDNFKFLVEKNDAIKAIGINVALNVDVPMRLYYDKDKYWLMRRQKSEVLNTIEIKTNKVFNTGFKGKQAFGETVFYQINKIDAGKTALTDVEFTIIEGSYFEIDMRESELLFKKKPTLNGDTTITIWVNGTESDLSFTIEKGDRTINNSDLKKSIPVSPNDKIGMSVETDGTTGEIEGLNLRFKLSSIWIKIPKSQNVKNTSYGDIKRFSAGMIPGGFMEPASTRYFPIGVMATAGIDKKTIAIFKAPSDGFLLISEMYVNFNTFLKKIQVSILRKKGEEYEPTSIICTVPPGATKWIKVPFSEKVKKDEEFILEITTPAQLIEWPLKNVDPLLKEQLGGITMNVYFVPFNNNESFLTTRNGYSFDILKFNRTAKSNPIHTENGRTMTWNDLDAWIRKTNGSRISVGPVQTLIETANNTVRKASPYINMMIPPLDMTDIALFLDHLSDPEKALAIGVALIRWQYNFPPDSIGQNQSTQFDLPLVGTVHNAQRRNNRIKVSTTPRWGLVFADMDSYIRNSASIFNLAQRTYNKIDFIPSIQFKK